MQKKDLIMPQLSADLAEETGIHIGDGSMNLYRSSGKNHWGYVYSAHAEDDKDYAKYVKSLMKKLYNLDPQIRVKRTCMMLSYTRKNLVLFKRRKGLPFGKKNNITIPKWIFKKKKYLMACIRGIVDTDGCVRFRKPYKGKLNNYPEIRLSNKSKQLIFQVAEILRNLGFKPSLYEEKISKTKPNHIWVLNLNGVNQLEKYLQIIRFSNPKHSNKINFWRTYGYYDKESYKKWRH